MSDGSPAAVVDLAASCVRFVKRAIGIDLDYTADTLPLLDHYVRELDRDTAKEVLALVVPAIGAYFGEVVRNALEDGHWKANGDDYDAWELSFERCSMRFNPMAVAYELVSGGEGDFHAAIEFAPADRTRAAAILEGLGEVREDDYYLFSVRLEAIVDLYANLTGIEPGVGPDRSLS
jgi:hypothetical protein